MDVSKKIVNLLIECFPDTDRSQIKSFYNSFETEGNVIIAHQCENEIRLTRGAANAVNPIGIVNRVPCRLHCGRKKLEGHYLYFCGVSSDHRGKGVFRSLIENANSDSAFTILIPEKEELIPLYHELGYSETETSYFPFRAGADVFDGIELRHAEEDYSALNSILSARHSDGITFGGIFNAYILRTMRDICLDYITENGEDIGYVFYASDAEGITLYDFYSPKTELSAIASKYGAEKKVKSLIRFNREFSAEPCAIPALNCAGEY